MFFPCVMVYQNLTRWITQNRKEKQILPARNDAKTGRERRFSLTSDTLEQSALKRGSMTLETACVLPMFLFAMLCILQFAQISLVSSALLAGMHDTARDMAAYAYIREMGVSAGEGVAAEVLEGGISAAYARNRITKKSGFTGNNGRFSILQSGFVKNNMIDLAVTYYPNGTFKLLPVRDIKAVLRARVRMWTGRDGSGGQDGENAGNQEKKEKTVFVTATGKVYHRDENCSHIKLSIKTVSKESLKNRRNLCGEKYHACEKCGSKQTSSVYITDFGDKYHSSLTCSGLKRSVLEVPESKVKGWKPCSKCGGK